MLVNPGAPLSVHEMSASETGEKLTLRGFHQTRNLCFPQPQEPPAKPTP